MEKISPQAKYARKKRLSEEYREKQSVFYKNWYAKNGRNRSANYKDVIILWQKENPEKKKAHNILQEALRKGIIVKSEKCEICEKKAPKIHGHHHDYTRPTEVSWVCASCHKKIHTA